MNPRIAAVSAAVIAFVTVPALAGAKNKPVKQAKVVEDETLLVCAAPKEPAPVVPPPAASSAPPPPPAVVTAAPAPKPAEPEKVQETPRPLNATRLEAFIGTAGDGLALGGGMRVGYTFAKGLYLGGQMTYHETKSSDVTVFYGVSELG
jgi:outer membrane biosynthesis protein TonB